MAIGLIGKKVGMTQLFSPRGDVIPVTVIEAGPCPIVQVKSKETDGYEAIQIGFGQKRENTINNPVRGHFRKANVPPLRFLREFRVESVENFQAESNLLSSFSPPGNWLTSAVSPKAKASQES